jgi:hypothetical protein
MALRASTILLHGGMSAREANDPIRKAELGAGASAAIAWFHPAFAWYFLNLEHDHCSGSTICLNFGPDHSEWFRVVRFWLRTGSNL